MRRALRCIATANLVAAGYLMGQGSSVGVAVLILGLNCLMIWAHQLHRDSRATISWYASSGPPFRWLTAAQYRAKHGRLPF